MNTKNFKTGDIVTPELLNELQNPSFNKQPGEVGHLPLPPNYSEKQQCKTIYADALADSVDLGDWPYNAVIMVHKRMNGETPVYPQHLSIQCANTTGIIIVIPELAQNGTLTIYVQGSGSSELATTSLKKNEIAIINAYINIEGAIDCFIRKFQSGDRPEYTNVLSSLFTVNGGDGHKASIYIDSNFNLVIAAANNSTVNAVDLKIPLKVSSLTVGKVKKSMAVPTGLTTNDTRNTLGLYFERYTPDTLDVFRMPDTYSNQGGAVGMDTTFELSGYNATIGEVLTVHNVGNVDLEVLWEDYKNHSLTTTISKGNSKQFVALSATQWNAMS